MLVLKGSELDTRYGHFLVYGVNDGLLEAVDFADVTMDPVRLIVEAEAHGALAIPAHPGRPRIGLCEFVDNGVEFPGLGIVETLNGGSRSGENERALEMAGRRGYRGIGGSDAHLASSIGTCLTSFDADITDERELLEALRSGNFRTASLEDTNNG